MAFKMQQIYKITNNLNGKAYIGQHKGSIGWYFGSGTAIKKAIKKHGKSNFTKEILVEGDFDNELLDFLEIEAIEKHQTYAGLYPKKGYNMNFGGAGQQGRVTYVKAKEQFIGRKKVYEYSLEGKFLREHRSLASAAISKGISYTAISNSLRKDGLQSGGSQWRLTKTSSVNKHSADDRYSKRVNPKSREVEQLTMDGDVINRYPSIKKASTETSILVTGIRYCCLGKYSYYKGFRWRFAIKTALDNPNNQL